MNISVIIDLAVVLVILVSAGVAFFRGFVREVLTIFGVIGGALAAFFFGPQIAPLFFNWLGVEDGETPKKLFNLIPYDIVANICAYASIFLAVFLILQLISHFLSASVRAVGLGPVDRTLGVVFGIARGILLLGILYLPFHLILPDDNKREWFGNAKTFVYVESVSTWLQSFLPADADEKAGEAAEKTGSFTRDKLKEIDVLQSDIKAEIKSKTSDDAEDDSGTKIDTGYDKKERKDLDSLIEEKSEEPAIETKPIYND